MCFLALFYGGLATVAREPKGLPLLNDRLESLPGYPFARLRRLLEGVNPPAGVAPVLMSIGEPQHPPPALLTEVLSARAADWGKYPPLRGTPEFRRAVTDWLTKRYHLPGDFIEAERNVLPVSGTREAIFMFAQVAVRRQSDEGAERQRTYGHNTAAPGRESRAGKPLVLVPNPLYHVYAGAAIMAGGEPLFLPATKATGFLPDFAAVPEDVWPRVSLVYLCSPANPQGAMASLDYLTDLIGRAIEHDFIVACDECYSEIYDDAEPTAGKGPLSFHLSARGAPTGALEACATMGADAARALDHVVVFNSLSKRSNCAGLRSGFVAGGARLIAAFTRLREFASCATPLPAIHAATELWRDETHVAANRARYRGKLDIADRAFSNVDAALGNRFGYYRPAGGFFLWLDVSGDSKQGGGANGEDACARLWREAAIRVLPGAYLCPEHDPAPGDSYIRVALVQNEDVLRESLTRMADVLSQTR